jgi:hypothetical protein
MDDCHLYYITRLKRKTVPELTYNVALNTNNFGYWLDDYKYNTYLKGVHDASKQGNECAICHRIQLCHQKWTRNLGYPWPKAIGTIYQCDRLKLNILAMFNALAHPHRCSVYDRAKIFLTSKFNYLLFCNPTHKTETGTANRWELLITNHLDQSLWLLNQKQGAAVRSCSLHSSLAAAHLRCASYQPQQIEPICKRKTIFLRWTGICWRFLEDLRPLDEEKSTYATISFWILFPTFKLLEVRNSVMLNFLKNQIFYHKFP